MKKFDIIISVVIAVIILAAVCVLFGVRKKADVKVLGTKEVYFQVYLRNIPYTDQVPAFIPGQKTFITIRNVPYKKVEIVNVMFDAKKIAIPNPKDKKGYSLINDPSQPFHADMIVILKDVAQITSDGAVVAGNKIKSGVQVVLEGQKYRFNGIVSGVQLPEDLDENMQVLKAQNNFVKTQKEVENADK